MQMIIEIFEHTIMISFFVMVMLLLIEYITVQTKGQWTKSFQRSGFGQIIFAAFMGILPGCLGAFIVVSLYAHRVLSFAALVAAMIATAGDEIFIMVAMIPGKTLVLLLILFVIAVI